SAMNYSSRAIATDPSSPDGYLVKADVQRSLGMLEEAKSDFHKAFEVAPHDPDVLRAYGYQLLRERNEKGAEFVLKSIENQYSARDPEYYLALNDAYDYVNDPGTQEKLLKKSKGLNPGLVDPYLSLSYIYERTGQLDKATRELKDAEKI